MPIFLFVFSIRFPQKAPELQRYAPVPEVLSCGFFRKLSFLFLFFALFVQHDLFADHLYDLGIGAFCQNFCDLSWIIEAVLQYIDFNQFSRLKCLCYSSGMLRRDAAFSYLQDRFHGHGKAFQVCSLLAGHTSPPSLFIRSIYNNQIQIHTS